MPNAELVCIVEGHGDKESVPILVRRIASTVDAGLVVHIPAVIRIPRDKLVKEGELERAVHLAARNLKLNGAILILVDADDACPATLGPELLRRASDARPDIARSIVLAKFEFEAWFLAAAQSLRGVRGLPMDLDPPAAPEGIRGAKGWLSERMPADGRYSETIDQPAMTGVFDLAQALAADSFDKCSREVQQLLRAVMLA